MAKLTRVTGKTFGETATATGLDPEIAQFGSALAGTYNGTTDVATIQGLSAWSNGFIDAVTPTNQYPPLPEVTGALKVLSYQENYLLQQGVAEWDSATTYYTNSFCSYDGTIYKSLQDNNLNQQPDNATTYWEQYGAISDYANQDLSNLTTNGEAKLQYSPFAINAGTVTSGNNGTLTYSGAIITCDPCTITTADGRTKTFANGGQYDVSGDSDGSYYIFKSYSTGALSLKSTFTISKVAPNTPSNDDLWLDISTIPANLKEYDGSWTANNDLVYIGNCTVASGVVSVLSNNLFNDSSYLVDRSIYAMFNAIGYDLTAGVSKSTSGFTADEDGWLTAYLSGNSAILVNGNSVMQQSITSSGRTRGWAFLYKGDVVTKYNTAPDNMTFYPLRRIK